MNEIDNTLKNLLRKPLIHYCFMRRYE